MTDTLRKRAERQRRREAGEVRVECWISSQTLQALDFYCQLTELKRSDAIESALQDYLAK